MPVDQIWIKLGQLLCKKNSRIEQIKGEMQAIVIPSLRTLEFVVNTLKLKISEKKPLTTDLGVQESVFRRLGSITDKSPHTLIMDEGKENKAANQLKIDIAGSDFKFSRPKMSDEVCEGKLYVFNQNRLLIENQEQAKDMILRRKILISLLRFRDSMEMLEGTVSTNEMFRAKSLNFKCKKHGACND